MSENSSKAHAGRGRRLVDRRDEAVGATLVGLVVVLLGYASGIGAGGGGGGVSSAVGGGPPNVVGSSGAGPAPDTSPVIVQASSSSAAADGDGFPLPGDPTSPGVTNQPSAHPTPSGAPSSSSAGPTPTPTPSSGPTVIVSQSQSLGPTDTPTSTPSPSGLPSGTPSPTPSSTPTTPGGLLTGLLPSNLLPCLLGPVDNLLGLGGLLGQCPSSTAPGAVTP